MHDIKFIRSHPAMFDANLQKRGIAPCANSILELDKQMRALQSEVQELQEERNSIAKQIAAAKNDLELIKKLGVQAGEIKKLLPQKEEELLKVQAAVEKYLIELPNILAEEVPIGADEEQNLLVRTWGKPTNFESPLEHWQLGETLKQMDFASSARMSGSRFVVLTKELAQLERAVANFMLDVHTQEYGFMEISPPLLVKEQAMFGAGQLPKFAADSFATTDGFRLIPTAEVSLVNMVAEQIIAEEELPLRYTAYTNCFRSEAGSAGRDTKGMLRLHQFSKVELVSIVRPQDSQAEHERITAAAESILQKLELPYRVMLLCSGDTGFSAHKTYDLEVWLPGQNKYREISSCSNCIDFQARRMKARYKEYTSKKNSFVHTLNGSGLAVGRTVIAIMENYQNADGSIAIPTILQQYMNGKKFISNK
jgi:seryl-tRNA synthetase